MITTKVCFTCRSSKALKDFSKNPRRKDGLNGNCKLCHKAYRKSHYEKHRKKYIDKASIWKASQIEQMRKLKNKPCADCKIQYSVWVMQFDHIRDKDFTIAEKAGCLSSKRIVEEISKCEVVCANCHAERTHRRQSNHGVAGNM